MTKPAMHGGTDDEVGRRRGVGRRTVIQAGAAAWTAPVILTAAAAPALASSGDGAIGVSTGSTAATLNGGGEYYDVVCSGLSITATASGPAGALVLTVTFTPIADEGDPLIYKSATNPPSWSGPSPGEAISANSLSYIYTGAMSAGVPVAFPDGVYFGTNVLADTDEGEGVFTLTFSAPGLTPGSATLPTPHSSGPRPAAPPTRGAVRTTAIRSSSGARTVDTRR